MPVKTTHPQYAAHIGTWTKCRTVYEGEDAVKEAGHTYLRRIDPRQTGQEYAAYLDRAIFHPAFARTVDGCTGSIARRDHVVDLPTSMQPFLADTTCDGVSLAEFVKLLSTETLITGRAGIMVDYDDDKQRSYLSLYTAESITNWGDDFVVLREQAYEADPDDRFKLVPVVQYRELHMVDGAYTVTIWRKKTGMVAGAEFYVFDERTPRLRTGPLDALPFYWLSYMGRTPRIVQPPLLGLVNVSLNHWRMSADLQHGRHFTGLPTLVVTGADSDETIRVGSASAILLKSETAKVYYAEFTGQGLGSLERGLADLAAQMAQLGASVFGGGQRAAETAEAARLRVNAESSILTAVVDAVQDSLQAALVCAGRWHGAYGEPTIALNRQFHDVALDAQTLTAMVGALQAGAITPEAFAFNLKQAELLPPEAAAA